MVYIIDASMYVFRAWFSIDPETMIDDQQNPVNALFGFASFLGDFLEKKKPEYVAVAFDESLKTCFRNEIYPDYKANREPAPDDLKKQFARCRAVTRALGMMECAEETYEADDLIGTITVRMRRHGMPATILSRDKDLVQLLREGDEMWDYASNTHTRYHEVADSYGIQAEQMVDYLALAGDSVDNIPGVKGVGPKTATALLAHFGSFDNLYENLDQVASLNLRGAATLGDRLARHHDDAILSRKLTKIHCDVPVTTTIKSVTRRMPDLDALYSLYDEAGFGTSLRRQAQRLVDSF